ncbi:MAG: hypothetical protein VX453_05925 [Acidobacteriota bacterium]|nr:hypothetical protein [Acidobacteriota bacterium]
MPDCKPPSSTGPSAWSRRRFVCVSLLVFVLLAMLHTWPLAQAPGTLSRNDNADTVLHEWTLAWLAHQIVQDPLNLFDANIFYPDRLTLAYSDHLFIPGIFVAPLFWIGFSPVLVYNLLLITGFALTGWAMSVLVHQWTGNWVAGLISGSLVAFNAITLTRFPQIQEQHLEFFPVALWALDRLFSRPSVRRALSLAGWFVLQSLTTGYWLLFTTVAMVAATAARPKEWLKRSHWAFVPHAMLAGTVAGGLLLPFLLPYWTVSREQGLVRSLDEVARYSAHFGNYLATGGRLHFTAWSERFYVNGAESLFPGVIALTLVIVAIGSGVALRNPRARMVLSFGGVAFALSFGPALPGYAILYDVFPLMHGIRNAARFGQLFLVAIAILAGFGWVRVWQALRPATRASRRLALSFGAAVLVGVHAEAIRTPIDYSVAPTIPAAWDILQYTGDDTVVALFPFYDPPAFFQNGRYLLYSTRHFKPMLNGYSGFAPPSYRRHADALRSFPQQASLDYLRSEGVTHVVVEGHLMRDSVTASLERVRELQLMFTDGNLRVYELTTTR